VLACGGEKWRRHARCHLGVGVGAAPQQQRHCLHATGRNRQLQRACLIPLVSLHTRVDRRLGLVAQQPLHNVRGPRHCSNLQRAEAVVSHKVDICSSLQQQLCQPHVAIVGSVHQCAPSGHAAVVMHVHVGAGIQQAAALDDHDFLRVV